MNMRDENLLSQTWQRNDVSKLFGGELSSIDRIGIVRQRVYDTEAVYQKAYRAGKVYLGMYGEETL